MTSRIRLGLIALAWALPCLLGAQSGTSTAQSQIAEANKPATVMIYTRWTSTISVPREQIRGQALVEFATNQAKLGLIPNNANAMFRSLFDELLRHPNMYLVSSGDVFTKEVDTAVTGSGFIITPDGYIVTNAHVLYEDPDDLRQTIVAYWSQNQLKDLFQADFASFKKLFESRVGSQTIQDTIDAFVNAEKEYYAHNMTIANTATRVYALMGVGEPGWSTTSTGRMFPCEVRKSGEPIPGKDVAILKIGENYLPTVQLGDDSAIKPGDSVTVLQYPIETQSRMATGVNDQKTIETTASEGLVSARKIMPGGWPAFQTSAGITHKNSGGPVFNDHGEVIGVAAFVPVEGINVVVPISVVREFLKPLNIKPQQSRVSQLYQAGIANMFGGCYKKALNKFEPITGLRPGFPYVQDKIMQSRIAIDKGLDHCLALGSYIAATAGGLLLAITGLWFVIRRRAASQRLLPIVAIPESAVPIVTEKGGTEPPSGADEQAGKVAHSAPKPIQDDAFMIILERLNRMQAIAEFKELSDGVQRAIKIAPVDPDMALTRARKVLESIIHDAYRKHYKEPPGTRPLENLLQRLVRDGVLPKRLAAYANAIRELGNVGTHGVGELVTTKDVTRSLEDLMTLLEWYFDKSRPESLAQEAGPRDRPSNAQG